MNGSFKIKMLLSSRLLSIVVLCAIGCWPADAIAKAPDASGWVSEGIAADDGALAQARTFPASGLNESYILGVGDSVIVNIFNVPEYSGPQKVLANGALNLPVAGMVNVEGLTLQAAGQAIAAAYRGELRYPTVTVVLESARPLRVAIAGEVSQPGLYTLMSEGEAQFPTVAQALQTAGGVTQAADLRQVQLKRSNSGRTELVTLDLWALLNNGDVEQDLELRDGDAIVIAATNTVDIAQSNRLSASNLAASVEQDIVVAVVGEVFRPGAYEFGGVAEQVSRGRTTVTKVVQTAGGVKPSADIRNIQVRRSTRNGQEQLIDLDLWALLQQGDISQDLVLQQGDTVVIPTATSATPNEIAQLTAANFSPAEVNVNIVGEVERPGTVSVSPNTTLNQAVLAAGGFTNRARETVELIRLNPNGTVTKRQVEIDLSEGLDAESNPLVLKDDVIIVGRNGRARFSDSVESVLSPILRLIPLSGLLF